MTSLGKISVKYMLTLSVLLSSCILFSSICLALDIRVRESLEIDGDTVYLGDLAEFYPADDSRVEKFKAIKISTSPSPGALRQINSDLILYKISHLVNAEKDVNLSLPETISIKRTAQILDSEALENIFRDYVLDNAPWESDQIVFEDINAPESIALPKGDLVWEIDEKQNRNFIGNFSLMIDLMVDGDSLRKIIVSGKISVVREVVRAVRNINRGDIISAEDIVVVSEKRTRDKKSLVASKKELIGKRATRRIQADQMIQAGMVEVPPAVEKGDRVVIKAENKNLLITALGEALEEGSIGEYIRVMNISSGREIIAMVTRTDLVEVQF